MSEEGWSACLSDAGPWVTHGWRKAVTEAAGKGTQDTSRGVGASGRQEVMEGADMEIDRWRSL